MQSESITLAADQFQALQSRLAQLESAESARTAELEVARTKALIATGQSDAVIRATQERVNQANDTVPAISRPRAASSPAPAAQPLAAPHMAAQLEALLGDKIVAHPVGESWRS